MAGSLLERSTRGRKAGLRLRFRKEWSTKFSSGFDADRGSVDSSTLSNGSIGSPGAVDTRETRRDGPVRDEVPTTGSRAASEALQTPLGPLTDEGQGPVAGRFRQASGLLGVVLDVLC